MSSSSLGNGHRDQRSAAGVAPSSDLDVSEVSSALDWRGLVATGLYRTGVLRLMQRISCRLELQKRRGAIFPRLRRTAGPKFVILCYHRIGIGGIPIYSELPQGCFEAQMHFLRKHYRVLSLQEVCKGLQDPSGAEPGVAVTFDDGYQGVFTEAFPILSKYRIPATVFLTAQAIETGRVAWYDCVFLIFQMLPSGTMHLDIDGPRRFELSSKQTRLAAALEIMYVLRSLPDQRRRECWAALEKLVTLNEWELTGRMLNWSQIKTMQQAGIEFGSHTLTHPVVSRLTESEMEKELTESKCLLEARLGRPVTDFAFPFGQFSDCGLEISSRMVARCGYRCAVTTVPGANTPATNPFALHRVQIGEERNLAMFAFRLNQYFLEANRNSPAIVSAPLLSHDPETGPQGSSVFEGTRHA